MKPQKTIFAGIACLLLLTMLSISQKEEASLPCSASDIAATIDESKRFKIRMISESANEDGSVTKTFGYTVLPADATMQDITASAAFIDDSSCEEVLSVSVSTADKTVSLTCFCAFDRQIIVRLVSVANPDASATVTLDYVKKLLAIEKRNPDSDYYAGKGWNSDYTRISDFSVSNFIAPQYSVYTKDAAYSFKAKNVYCYLDEVCTNTKYSRCFTEDVTDGIKMLLEEKIQQGDGPVTAEELWNISTDAAYHSALYAVSQDDPSMNYLGYMFSATFYCVEVPTKILAETSGYLSLSLMHDYTGFTVDVESLTAEVPSIEF